MDYYSLSAFLLTAAVFVGYLNHRFIHLQATIAVMSASLFVSLILIVLNTHHLIDTAMPTAWIHRAHFQDLLLKGMLGFLLFAGSLTIDLQTLKAKKWEIGVLASVTTLASALLIGLLTYFLLPYLGLAIPFLYCLLFGALISPTDPIAVLATFKNLNVSKQLQTCVAGESLFNDGVGIVIFATVAALAFDHVAISWSSISLLFLNQTLGGLGYGFLLGILARYLIKSINDRKMITLITLAMVAGGYTLALKLGISGPLAMVVLGIFVGNYIRSTKTSMAQSLETFWEIIDEILNFILFLLIGLEMMVLHFSQPILLAMLMAIPLVLLVRLITVAIPIKLISLTRLQEPYTISILTWGGLRGGLALALALSLSDLNNFSSILSMSYSVVAFSVIVQGLTIAPLVRRSKHLSGA